MSKVTDQQSKAQLRVEMEMKLRQMQAELDKLQAQADKASAEARARYYEAIPQMRERIKELGQRIAQADSQQVWDKLGDDLNTAWEDLKQNISEATGGNNE